MLKEYLKGIYFSLGFISVFLVIFSVSAVGFHLASDILPGTFQTGNFIFDGNLNIGALLNYEKLNVQGNIYLHNLTDNTSLRLGGTDYEWDLIRDHGDSGKFKIHYLQGNLDALTIVRDGNIGIGTTSPEAKLNIISDGTQTNPLIINSSSGNGGIFLWENLINEMAFMMKNSSGDTIIYMRPDGNSYFNGGNIGIGTTTPTTKLDINGIIKIGTDDSVVCTVSADRGKIRMITSSTPNKIQACLYGAGSGYQWVDLGIAS